MIFNALIIIALIPLALRGVQYRPSPARPAFCGAIFIIYGIGGVIVPFIGIKAHRRASSSSSTWC